MSSLRRAARLMGCALPLAVFLLACEGTEAQPNPVVNGGSAGASAGGALSGTGGSAGSIAGAGGAGQSGMLTGGNGGGGAGPAGASGGGAAGAGSGGAGGNAAAGSAGNAGCTADALPEAGKPYTTTGWRAAWSVPCDFDTGNGKCDGVMPPEKAFDGKGDTRTSLGDTHLKGEVKTAQVVGDAFFFDMKSCHQVGKIVMYAAAPPANKGSFDPRDFPGALKVTASNDCTTSEGGVISGTFGQVVATATEPQPGCQGDACSMPMTIQIEPPVVAKCVKLELTKILQLGGGIWWAIDELQTFP